MSLRCQMVAGEESQLGWCSVKYKSEKRIPWPICFSNLLFHMKNTATLIDC